LHLTGYKIVDTRQPRPFNITVANQDVWVKSFSGADREQ